MTQSCLDFFSSSDFDCRPFCLHRSADSAVHQEPKFLTPPHQRSAQSESSLPQPACRKGRTRTIRGKSKSRCESRSLAAFPTQPTPIGGSTRSRAAEAISSGHTHRSDEDEVFLPTSIQFIIHFTYHAHLRSRPQYRPPPTSHHSSIKPSRKSSEHHAQARRSSSPISNPIPTRKTKAPAPIHHSQTTSKATHPLHLCSILDQFTFSLGS